MLLLVMLRIFWENMLMKCIDIDDDRGFSICVFHDRTPLKSTSHIQHGFSSILRLTIKRRI